MSKKPPEDVAQSVVTLCSNCEVCRDALAEAPCQFFPRLFVLSDRARADGTKPSSDQLKDLIDLCVACGQCPCQSIQVRIRDAKDGFVARDGLPPSVRVVEDIQLIGRLCGTLPWLTNAIRRIKPLDRLLKRAIGFHPDRKLPAFPAENFDAFAKARGLDRMSAATGRKVAYFVGCTARYMFPDVAKATVEVLQANGIAVYVPEQKCCGMPAYLEGDRDFTFARAETNLPILRDCIAKGYDIVTACPTCSFAFKSVLARSAQFAPAWQTRVKAMLEEEGGDAERVRARLQAEATASTGRANAASATFRKPWVLNQIARRHGDGGDEGYFAELDADLRIEVASHTWELGEYLRDLDRQGGLKQIAALPADKCAYFPPCHLREQSMGQPWRELLARVPGAHLETVGDPNDCCGLGGTMGFKTDFHAASLAMGRGLMEKTRRAAPDRVVTECLGCRVQFMQMLPYPVSHPVELLAQAYREDRGGDAE